MMIADIVEYTDDNNEKLLLKCEILDYISENQTIQIFNKLSGKPEIDPVKKKINLQTVFDENPGLFLSRFGFYLQEKHLTYFDYYINSEDKYIVDVHLQQLRKMHRNVCKVKESASSYSMETSDEFSNEERNMLELRNSMLDHLSFGRNNAHFKSQQIGEPELDSHQKRLIVEEVLNRSRSLFLSRFGVYLKAEHLKYFEKNKDQDDYEVVFYIKELKRKLQKGANQVVIKNRRFKALKQMLDNHESYFGETEMRKRNPLLYEHLIGQFLTDEEKRERDDIDKTNITFVNLLLEQIDRDAESKLKDKQIEAEDDVMEEEETSDEEDCNDTAENHQHKEDTNIKSELWGESYTDKESYAAGVGQSLRQLPKQLQEIPEVSESEKQLLMEEFRSNMFQSFLQGKDDNFDYSQVDFNPDYDDLVLCGIEEEEKYFDTESRDEDLEMKVSDEDDELDQFMIHLKSEPEPNELADQMQNLHH